MLLLTVPPHKKEVKYAADPPGSGLGGNAVGKLVGWLRCLRANKATANRGSDDRFAACETAEAGQKPAGAARGKQGRGSPPSDGAQGKARSVNQHPPFRDHQHETLGDRPARVGHASDSHVPHHPRTDGEVKEGG